MSFLSVKKFAVFNIADENNYLIALCPRNRGYAANLARIAFLKFGHSVAEYEKPGAEYPARAPLRDMSMGLPGEISGGGYSRSEIKGLLDALGTWWDFESTKCIKVDKAQYHSAWNKSLVITSEAVSREAKWDTFIDNIFGY